MIVNLNGRYVDEKKAFISIHDRGFLYGDGIYETLRVYNGHVFLLAEHLRRLKQSARGIFLTLPVPAASIGKLIVGTVKKNKLKEAVVRVTVTRGPGCTGFDPVSAKKPTLVISAVPFGGYPKSYYEAGIRLAVVSVRRNSPFSLPPSVKSTNCLNGILAKIESLKGGAQEALMLTLQGTVAEGSVSNVFIVRNGLIETPKLEGHLLPGTTRGFLFNLARKAGHVIRERTLKSIDLIQADEIFLTNTTFQVLPVCELVLTGPGKKGSLRAIHLPGKSKGTKRGQGPVTKALSHLFNDHVNKLRLS